MKEKSKTSLKHVSPLLLNSPRFLLHTVKKHDLGCDLSEKKRHGPLNAKPNPFQAEVTFTCRQVYSGVTAGEVDDASFQREF